MIDLNKEAEEYSNKIWGGYVNDVFKHDDIITDKTLKEITTTDFIAGANSKFVKQQILQAQINPLLKYQQKLGGYDALSGLLKQEIQLDIYTLQQELKQLEDE